ncbi:MAG TPA: ISKra4 family transposase [Streptosporangiaceae bacterium]|nr:ISKra4 family transposase [Streptosporangiaceae bacterium]
MGCGDAGLEAAEQVIRAGLLRLGGSMLGELLAADNGYRGPQADCGQGHEAVFVSYRDKSFDTALGLVTVARAWYHCAECRHGLAPRDAELGVAGASMSPGLTAMNDIAAAAGPFAGAARLLEELAGIRLTAKRVERAAEESGTAAAAAGRERARLIASRKVVPLPPSPLPDKLYIVIDGTGVPMTARETAGREGKGEDGRARTREVKLGVFFTQDKLDKDGYPVRDRATTSIIATFEPAATFGTLVRAEGIRRGADHVRQLTVLGDGAAWIWGIATGKFPEATQIVDLFHAREHMHSLTRSLEFMLLDRRGEWLAARLEDLDYGDIDSIEAAVRAYPLEGVKKNEVDKELGYFLNNAPRMRYHWFRSRGLFVGSGVVEASCKTIVAQRLKQAGMHWTVAGADAIIALRCKQASSQWEAICNTPHTQTRTARPGSSRR